MAAVLSTNGYDVHGLAGGGYALDGDQSHLKFWESVQADLNNAGKSVATIFISYTLSSDQAYPTQICQGVEALNYFLEEKRRSASEVILGGDSAGGGIALAVLSQISHPSPDLPRVNLNGKLQAVVVMSPWISFNFDWPSFTSNEYKDCIPVTRLKAWSAEYKNGHPSNNYIEAVEAPAEWWEGAHVKQVLCTAGGDEILLDSIMAWVDKYKVGPC